MSMGTEGLAANSGVKCGACGQVSTDEAKFCAGCGQSLFEPCGSCGKPVLLTQKFCGSCGANLEDALLKRIQTIEGWMADAVESAKKQLYDQAIISLRRAADPPDYRFNEIASQAKEAVEKVQALRDRATASAAALAAQAKQAFENNLNEDAVRFVQQIPEALRCEESKQILANSLTFMDQESSLVGDLQNSIKERNWILAGDLLQQALGLSPEDTQYQKLGARVASKLYKLCDKYVDKCNYARAVECLNSIPESCRGEDHAARQNKIQRILWLSQQFDPEPFATATLGRLAVRLSKEAEHDESAPVVVKELAAQVKQKAETPRDPWAPWRASRESWMGGPAGFLAYPQSIQYRSDSSLRKIPGRFSVAIGLAAQGIGLGRIKENFIEAKGLLAGFRRKKDSAWGIDISSSGIRAVLLTRDEEGKLVVENDYYKNFDVPTCRVGQEQSENDAIRSALETMVEEVELGDTPVWVNLPAGDLVTRFMRLPPLADKQAKSMLQVEAEQRIPLPIEDLKVINWIADLGEVDVTGRPASVSAARTTVVQERLEVCSEAGLKVTGMQADSLALVNFIDLEFAELWPNLNDKEDDDEDSSHFSALNEKLDSVLLLDAGASTTTLVIVSPEAFWFWNAESGGELLTTAIATNSKLIAADAEEKKLNPALLEEPGMDFAVVEQRQNELRARLEKMVGEATKQNERFEIIQSWCVGGASLTHGWIRRVMLQQDQ